MVDAAKSGFDYTDLDLGTPNQIKLINNLKQAGTKVIVSFHDFEQTPSISKLNKVLEDEIALGSNVCKIVTTAKRIEDNLIRKANKKLDKIFAEKADKIIEDYATKMFLTGLEKIYIRTDNFGQPIREPTSISIELNKISANFAISAP